MHMRILRATSMLRLNMRTLGRWYLSALSRVVYEWSLACHNYHHKSLVQSLCLRMWIQVLNITKFNCLHVVVHRWVNSTALENQLQLKYKKASARCRLMLAQLKAHAHRVMIATWRTRSWWHHTCFRELEHKKIEFFMYAIDGLYVIHYMKYEGIELEHIEGTTVGKDFNVWFDCTGEPLIS